MSRLTEFRDHCRQMATAEHKPECPSLAPQPGPVWIPVYEHGDDIPSAMRFGGFPPPPPHCDGCVTDTERTLFARMANEVDDYLEPQIDLFGTVTPETETV